MTLLAFSMLQAVRFDSNMLSSRSLWIWRLVYVCLCDVRPYAKPTKLKEMIEQSKMFSLQLPWAQRLAAVLQEASDWTDSAQQLLVCSPYLLISHMNSAAS